MPHRGRRNCTVSTPLTRRHQHLVAGRLWRAQRLQRWRSWLSKRWSWISGRGLVLRSGSTFGGGWRSTSELSSPATAGGPGWSGGSGESGRSRGGFRGRGDRGYDWRGDNSRPGGRGD